MSKNYKIIGILKEINSQSSLNGLIETCQKIAQTYLHFNYKKIFKFLQNEDLTLEEFALDAIAPLFIKEKDHQNIYIKTAFNNWQPPIKTEEDALYFLNKVVSHRVEQHIYSILREEDPFFSKILDSVNYLIKSQGFIKIQSYGKTYIVRDNYEICDTTLISQQEFENIPIKLFIAKKKILQNLIDYFESETQFIPAIPLNDLIYRLKHINFSEYAYQEPSEISNKQFEMDEIINLALNSALEKLNNSYTLKGKLSEEESKSLNNALKDLCEDLKNGGINPGLYSYLSPYMKDLSKENYKENYHNILEYLLKITKGVIANNLVGKK